ncbi:XdhC family protein [Microbacterium sp. bgisy203]|uniref:XdhC family protein n=1 Tax=Microbacterium sp. bgisy203 TaxID=3413799 RepID=UPI003D721956
MRDILDDAVAWLGSGRAIAVATVVAVRGSAPRELGASMIVAEVEAGGLTVRGNVSGGCVEGAVIEACLDALATGRAGVASYGIAEDDLLGVGLMCGGSIDVLVRPVRPGTPEAADLARLRDPQAPLVLTLAVRGDELGGVSVGGVSVGGAGDPGIPPDAAALAGGDRARLLSYDGDGCLTEADPATQYLTQYLVVPFGGPPRLVIVGAVQYGVALSRIGAACGYAVTVVDPRDAFADAQRFPDAEVVRDWPDRWLACATLDDRTAVCVLSHDEKIDVPALRVALASSAGYVGAMGSRRTHDDRLDRLRAAGVTPAQLARLRSPIGLDLGGRSAEETALSILAEIVAVRHGRSAVPLTEASGPLHAAGS